MARVVSQIMAVFLLGPIFIPAVGQVVLDATSWRGVFAVAIAAGAVALVWTIRFGETLPVSRRRAFDRASFVDGARRVAANRATVAYIAAQTCTTAAFFIFLGSSQPIMDQVYGRADQFARWFGVAGVIMAMALIFSQRAIGRWGSRRMVSAMLSATVACSVAGMVVFAAADGVPSFAVWFVWVAAANATLIVVTPMCNALALEPMGELAGTASALLGFVTLAGGAVAASVVDLLIVDTVTPMAVGYTAFSILALTGVSVAGRLGVTHASNESLD
jgi:DHA1 family bicyclomycin/chloramphenicol resistance-like MFS transporter